MPLLRAFPWETAVSVHARRSASAALALPAPLPSPSHRLSHTRPSLCTLPDRTQFKTHVRGSGARQVLPRFWTFGGETLLNVSDPSALYKAG